MLQKNTNKVKKKVAVLVLRSIITAVKNGGIDMASSRIKVVIGKERIITPSGLGIVGGMLGKSDFRKHCDRQKINPKRSQPQIKNGDILLSYIGNLTLGKTDFEAVREFSDDPEYYREALGIVREKLQPMSKCLLPTE